MDINVTSDKENRLLNRREIEFSIVHDGATPSKNDIRAELCKKLSLNPESVIIVSVGQSTGVRQGSAVAHAYSSKELIEKLEPEYLVNRMKGIRGGKKAAAPKEEKPKEAEVKEEEKAREKKAGEKKTEEKKVEDKK